MSLYGLLIVFVDCVLWGVVFVFMFCWFLILFEMCARFVFNFTEKHGLKICLAPKGNCCFHSFCVGRLWLWCGSLVAFLG